MAEEKNAVEHNDPSSEPKPRSGFRQILSDPPLEFIEQHFKDLDEQGIHPRPKNEVLKMLKAEERKKGLPPPPMPNGVVLDGPGAPRAFFFLLRDLLNERKNLPVDEAARLLEAPTKRIEEYVRLYPTEFLWIDGQPPTIALAAAPETTNEGKGTHDAPGA